MCRELVNASKGCSQLELLIPTRAPFFRAQPGMTDSPVTRAILAREIA